MVLKVVRGKILETLELRGLLAQEKLQLPRKIQKTNDPNFAALRLLEAKYWKHGSYGDSGPHTIPLLEQWMNVRLSKIAYYLIDNIFVLMLSQLE